MLPIAFVIRLVTPTKMFSVRFDYIEYIFFLDGLNREVQLLEVELKVLKPKELVAVKIF